jgi:tetratricopeptide (TPR) repeat protein
MQLFLSWYDAMQSMPGVTFKPAPMLRAALAETDASAFALPSRPLDTRAVDRAAMPKNILDFLSSHQPDYDAYTADAQRRLRAYGAPDALKALSSLVEENPGDTVLARDVAFSALEWGLRDQAVQLLSRVAVARPYEPQTYRAMANALAALGKNDLAIAYYELALAGQWDSRFGDFRQILAVDYVRFLRRLESRSPLAQYARSHAGEVSEAAQIPSSSDLVVMITWNTDNSDVDLHVVEPSGEECYYGHRDTKAGGHITRDVTQGYGPEMYVISKARAGSYAARAKYFTSERNRASARTKVYATVIENWGMPRERVTDKVVTLAEDKEMHDIMWVDR